MTITVTGATGQLGRLVIEELLSQGVSAARIAAVARDPQKASSLGVAVREADYFQPETLKKAFAGTQKLLFISSGDTNERQQQHRNVVDAAAAAGVSQIIYTGILNAETTTIALAADHQATEGFIRDSGLPHVFLRNSWYLENYTSNLASALEHGVILGSAGEGRVAAAARSDLAAAAVAVLTSQDLTSRAYELGGDTPFTLAELAAEVARQTGKPVSYQDLPEAEYAAALKGFGLPEQYAHILADADSGIARGELTTASGDLSRLIGRPTTTLAAALSAVL